MRLNFSGVNEDDIREGVRRIGEVVREQVAMYGTLTGVRPPRSSEADRAGTRAEPPRPSEGERAAQRRQPPAEGEPATGSDLAKILRLPAKRQRAG